MDARDEQKPGELSPVKVRLPDLIAIPVGSASKECECGARIWWVKHNNRRIPVSCPAAIDTKSAGRIPLDTRAPTGGVSGLGINHYIDCQKRAKFSGSKLKPGDGAAATAAAATAALGPRPVVETADDTATRIRAAEALSEQYGVKCTGAPLLKELCNGPAVVAFVVGKTLFAAPCSAHADSVHRAIRLDRRSDYAAHPVDEYLHDRGPDVARRFAERCALIRKWNGEQGFKVPRRDAPVQ